MKQKLNNVLAITILALFVSCNYRYEGTNETSAERIVSEDISNQTITSFAEDDLGYIWIGTLRGLNKFVVNEYHQYFSSEDTGSLCDNKIRKIHRDTKNRFWIGTSDGICRYTDMDGFEEIPNESISRNVVDILEDRNGRIFLNMVISLSEYNPQNDRFETKISNFDPERNFTNRCFLDKSNKLWSVTATAIRCYNTSTFEEIFHLKTDRYYHYVFMSDDDVLWLASGNYLAIFDTRKEKYVEIPEVVRKHPVLSEAVISYMYSYSNSSILINTPKGLFLYNFITHTVIHQSEDGFPFEAPDFIITAMFTDTQKNLWIGSLDNGYSVCYSYKDMFNSNHFLRSRTDHQSVTSVVQDNDSRIWIATQRNGMLMYHTADKTIKNMDTQKFFPESKIYPNRCSRIFIDDENAVWLMTDLNKIIKCRYHDKELQEEAVFWIPGTGGINCMTQDRNGTIYAAGFGENIFIMKKGEKEFTALKLYPKTFVYTTGLILLSSGEILVASFAQNLRVISPDNQNISEININKYIKRAVFMPTALYQDTKGDVWIATLTNGLFLLRYKTQTIETVNGASCNDIAAIEEDAQGNIWVSTLFGLSKYDRTIQKFTNYYNSDGIGGNQFNERSSYRLTDGTLIFGGTHGLTLFDPVDVTVRRNIPLVFENLKIFDKTVVPGKNSCIDRQMSYHPNIGLKHYENSFTISFAALDYSEYERVRYQYMLEGFDKFWINSGNDRNAHYSNMPAGSYTFKVKITNVEQTFEINQNAISIIIAQAPWLSWWAKCLYSLAGFIVVYLLYNVRRRIKINQQVAEQARLEKEQEQRVNKMNMSFFANMSHEFRTPLTMILGPINQLCEDASIKGENSKLLYIVQRSVNRMLKMINQLMDFNKLDHDALKLKVKRTNITSELLRLTEIFSINMNNKQISFRTIGFEDTCITWADKDKIDNIMANLISNALKYTPVHGNIEVMFDVIMRDEAATIFPLTSTDNSAQYIYLSVANSGNDIPEDQLEKIFERYYQLNQQQNGEYNWGTGIGLYYARRLTELHHGYIKASNRQGGGSVFALIIPVGDEAYTVEERTFNPDHQDDAFPLLSDAKYRLSEREDKTDERYTVLVVDDDTEIAHYLKILLSPYYNVVYRFDAALALKAIEENAPDLILSDVIMPGMSGYELCTTIKNDIHLCHIPVILVTAKATVENQVEGLNTGADAYVTKPFDPAYLLALLKSQLKNRENVRSLLGKTTQIEKIENSILLPQDSAFMKELYQLMEKELSNSELNITRITEEMKISRTKLYYKIKGLTGMNPNVFFKMYKLNRAKELLSEGKFNVSEIADITGFSTLPHFSVSFKKQFGMSPSEYMKNG